MCKPAWWGLRTRTWLVKRSCHWRGANASLEEPPPNFNSIITAVPIPEDWSNSDKETVQCKLQNSFQRPSDASSYFEILGKNWLKFASFVLLTGTSWVQDSGFAATLHQGLRSKLIEDLRIEPLSIWKWPSYLCVALAWKLSFIFKQGCFRQNWLGI